MALARTLLVFVLAGVAAASLGDQESTSFGDQESRVRDVVAQASDRLAQQFGWKREDVSVWDIDSKDISFGQALVYELDIDIGGTVLPVKLSEGISKWKPLSKSQNELLHPQSLPPFHVAGPVELWIQDAGHLRLSLPHDVDAGVLNRVFLADGANVTITGVREISLARPLKLPLIRDGSRNLTPLASKLKHASQRSDKPLLSLRVVGPSSMIAEQGGSAASSKLKVKRLSPGAVELVNRNPETQLVEKDHKAEWLWPLPSINTSNPKLQAVEQALEQTFNVILGPQASDQVSFILLKAKASASSLVKLEFVLERRLDNATLARWPNWATKPTVHRYRFELTARLGQHRLGHELLGLRQLDSAVPMPPGEGLFPVHLHGNISFTRMVQNLAPLSTMTL